MRERKTESIEAGSLPAHDAGPPGRTRPQAASSASAISSRATTSLGWGRSAGTVTCRQPSAVGLDVDTGGNNFQDLSHIMMSGFVRCRHLDVWQQFTKLSRHPENSLLKKPQFQVILSESDAKRSEHD